MKLYDFGPYSSAIISIIKISDVISNFKCSSGLMNYVIYTCR